MSVDQNQRLWISEIHQFKFNSEKVIISFIFLDFKIYFLDHCPYSFKWFMDEIAYGVVREYPLPPLNQYWGELKSAKGNQCLDSMGHTQGGTVETYYCHQQGGNQVCHCHTCNM